MAARSVNVVFINMTNYTLTLNGTTIPHGEWGTSPPYSVGCYSIAQFSSESDGFMTGTEASVTYDVQSPPVGLSCSMNWDNPFAGGNSYACASSTGLSIAAYGNTSGDNSTVIYVLQVSSD